MQAFVTRGTQSKTYYLLLCKVELLPIPLKLSANFAAARLRGERDSGDEDVAEDDVPPLEDGHDEACALCSMRLLMLATVTCPQVHLTSPQVTPFKAWNVVDTMPD